MVDISFIIQHLKDNGKLNVENLKSQMCKLSSSLVSDLSDEEYGAIIELYLLSSELVETFGDRFRFHTFEGVEQYLQMNLLDWFYIIASQAHDMLLAGKSESIRENVLYLTNFYKFGITVTMGMKNPNSNNSNNTISFKVDESTFCLN